MHTDFCIIGTGIAGMSAALRLSSLGKVILVTKKNIISGATPLAQGGIAAVSTHDDSFEKHIHDTLKSGHDTNNKKAVEMLVKTAPSVMKDLESWGIHFFPDKHLEGGHSEHRIFHTGDTTGKTIAEGLRKKILQTKNITLLDNTQVIDLILEKKSHKNSISVSTGKGVVCFSHTDKKIFSLIAKKTILAMGGYSSLYSASTSPKEALGDGIYLAIKNGMKIRDISKIQFHPTVLDRPRTPKLLLSEAIRGAGATIVNADEKEIIDPLLPRDIISKKIFSLQQSGEKIFLDTRKIKNFSQKFPAIEKILQEKFSLSGEKDLLPITPGAHYSMGGIVTDLHGRTSIQNIYASGECAFTGVHGENRLASNSLLEGLVFSKKIFEDIEKNYALEQREQQDTQYCPPILPSVEYKYFLQEEYKKKQNIHQIFSRYLGIEKNMADLQTAKKLIEKIQSDSKKNISTSFSMLLIVSLAVIDDAIKNFPKKSYHTF